MRNRKHVYSIILLTKVLLILLVTQVSYGQGITFPTGPLLPAAGSNEQVQYNNAGSLAGASGITSTGKELIINTTSSPTSQSNAVKIVEESIGTFSRLSTLVPNTYVCGIDPFFNGSRSEVALFSNSSSVFGSSATTAGGASSVTQTPTNVSTGVRRNQYINASTGGNAGYLLSNPYQVCSSTGALLKATFKFVLSHDKGNGLVVVGLHNRITFPTGSTDHTNTALDFVGVGHATGDGTLSLIYNDASGTTTKVDLGSNFPTDISTGYLLEIYASNATYYYKIVNLNTSNVATGTLTTNVPANGTNLNLFAASINTSGVTHGIHISHMAIKTNY